jgi:hypothetical protein
MTTDADYSAQSDHPTYASTLPKPDRLLTLSLAGALAGVSPQAVRAWVKRGRVPVIAGVGWRKIKLCDLERALHRTFSLADLEAALEVRAARIARGERNRKPKRTKRHATV